MTYMIWSLYQWRVDIWHTWHGLHQWRVDIWHTWHYNET